MKFIFNDGGRSKYYKGEADDCVVRSIAIITGIPYKEVYDELFERAKTLSKGRCRIAKSIKKTGASPRNGVHRKVYEKYLLELGFKWIPTMKVGAGCTVHLKKEELPNGRLIASLSRHLTSVIDGDLYDTFDCSRGGTRCVYGYYVYKKKRR